MESVFRDACDPPAMRFVALSVALLAVLGLLAGPAAAVPLDGVAQPDTSTPSALASGSVGEPSTTMDIRLQPDRSAEWDVTVDYRLDTASERAAFDTFADSYESGSAAGGPTADLYRNIAADVSAATDREMTIENVGYSATRSGENGRLRLSFTWTGFLEATTDGDTEQLVFNDVLRTQTGEPWLGSLGANQTLRIHTPRGYAITSANVAFADNTVVIEGPQTFGADDQIRIRYEESVFGAGSARFLGGAVIVASLIVGAAVLLRRTDSIHVRDTVLPSGDDGTERAADGAAPPTEQPPEPTPEPEEDLSLLADDERIERLLERNGGRMRQADIVEETNWSDAKVSQLLSSMEDEDRISKLRIGRENLITLPGVDAAGGTDDSDDGRADGADGDTTDSDSDTDEPGRS